MAAHWTLIRQTDDGTPGYAQFADLRLSDAWAARAVVLTTDAALALLDRRSWAEQKEAVLDAFSAMAWAYRAINLPPYSDPAFRNTFLDAFGGVDNLTLDDALNHRIRALIINSQQFQGAPWMRTRILALLARTPHAPAIGAGTGGVLLCGVRVRINLTEQADVQRTCFDGTTGEGDCNFVPAFGNWVGCENVKPVAPFMDADRYDCEPYSWNSFSYDVPPLFGAALPACGVTRALPPLRWFAEYIGRSAREFVARGARQVLEDGRLGVIERNTLELVRLGMLSNESEDLRSQSHALAADVARASYDNASKRQLLLGIASAAATAALFPAPYGVTASAILGVLGAILTVSPFAIGVETDHFGRGLPQFEVGTIEGSVTEPPRTAIPDPPGYSSAAIYDAAPRTAEVAMYHPTLAPLFIPAGGSPSTSPGGPTVTIVDGAHPTLVPLTPSAPRAATPATDDPTPKQLSTPAAIAAAGATVLLPALGWAAAKAAARAFGSRKKNRRAA